MIDKKRWLFLIVIFLIPLISSSLEIGYNDGSQARVILSPTIAPTGSTSNSTTNGTTYHNLLSGLQGGQSNQYYHLTNAEWVNRIFLYNHTLDTYNTYDSRWTSTYNETYANALSNSTWNESYANTRYLKINGSNANENINIGANEFRSNDYIRSIGSGKGFTTGNLNQFKLFFDTAGHIETTAGDLHLYPTGYTYLDGTSTTPLIVSSSNIVGSGIDIQSTATNGTDWLILSSAYGSNIGGGHLGFFNIDDNDYSAVIQNNSRLFIGTIDTLTPNPALAVVHSKATNNADIGLIVEGTLTQTGNLQEWRLGSASPTQIDKVGNFNSTSNVTARFFKGNGSLLTGVCLANGTNCISTSGNSSWNESNAFTLFLNRSSESLYLSTYNATYNRLVNNASYLSTYNATYANGINASWNQSFANTRYVNRSGDFINGAITINSTLDIKGRIKIQTTTPINLIDSTSNNSYSSLYFTENDNLLSGIQQIGTNFSDTNRRGDFEFFTIGTGDISFTPQNGGQPITFSLAEANFSNKWITGSTGFAFTSSQSYLPQAQFINIANDSSAGYMYFRKFRPNANLSASVGDYVGTLLFQAKDLSGTDRNVAFVTAQIQSTTHSGVGALMSFLVTNQSGDNIIASLSQEGYFSVPILFAGVGADMRMNTGTLTSESGQISFGDTNLVTTSNVSIGQLIKLESITLPACAAGTRGVIGRNATGVYFCGADAWRRMD